MILNEELLAIHRGEQGEGMMKILNTLIMYGEAFDASEMVKITGSMGHAVIGGAPVTWAPLVELFEEWVEEGLKSKVPLTTDPRPRDRHIRLSFTKNLMYAYLYSRQKRLEKALRALGVEDMDNFTCTPYLEQIGNIPQKGDILSWAESSAVVYVNSVLGARCNRNSGVIELMGNILGYVPKFGLLTDEGRKAGWIIDVRCESRPDPQILGSTIGMKVIDEVPFIKGLDQWIGTELNCDSISFLKDMGAAAASNGSVGLYHVAEMTPEAKEQGESIIRDGAPIYVIDDAELKRVKDSYPCMWDDPEASPEICFIGCPHLSAEQILDWADRIDSSLRKNGLTSVNVYTIFLSSPKVIDAVEKVYPDYIKKLDRMGILLTSICPLSFSSNPMCKNMNMITCSNKFRYYSHARFFSEAELVEEITKEVGNDKEL